MRVESLRLVDFRSYREIEATFAPRLTAVVGANGEGKTNLLEAITFAGGLGSLRRAPEAALIREGCDVAAVRCEVRLDDGRDILIEADIARNRPNRVLINRQRISRRRDMLEVLTLSVFSPIDLDLVQGEPGHRRKWLDESLAAVRPSCAVLRSNLDRILRQRNALLRRSAGRVTPDVTTTLDVWDEKLAAVGEELRSHRMTLLETMRPEFAAAYEQVARDGTGARATYISSWEGESLAEALAETRRDDLRRGVTTIGPHRDDVGLWIGNLPARSHASQGEQRSLALAMRLAADAAVRRQRRVRPVLLLDDVFSELDDIRSVALLEALPTGQQILTTASGLPRNVCADRTISIESGVLSMSSASR